MPLRNADPRTVGRDLPRIIHTNTGICAGFQRYPDKVLLLGDQRVERGNHQLVLLWIRPPQDTKISGLISAPTLSEILNGKKQPGTATRNGYSIKHHSVRADWLALENHPCAIRTQPRH